MLRGVIWDCSTSLDTLILN